MTYFHEDSFAFQQELAEGRANMGQPTVARGPEDLLIALEEIAESYDKLPLLNVEELEVEDVRITDINELLLDEHLRQVGVLA